MTNDTLTLSRMRFHSRHGVLPEEQARGQDFEVTVRLELPLAEAGRTDDLARTVDYRAIHAAVRSVMDGPPRQLVEAVAEGIAAELLRGFPTVQAIEVEVAKLRPPVDFASAGLSVKVRRSRNR
jgi:7,8-dihydroneopterin aldolase/epimerase/oxygenase